MLKSVLPADTQSCTYQMILLALYFHTFLDSIDQMLSSSLAHSFSVTVRQWLLSGCTSKDWVWTHWHLHCTTSTRTSQSLYSRPAQVAGHTQMSLTLFACSLAERQLLALNVL
uniref:Uncharacterized protein n=1 Tax=Eutreptiella gymnastica TaxID=73025 RepID=A0A7S4G171_9EUGL